jgi:hypothetical protein
MPAIRQQVEVQGEKHALAVHQADHVARRRDDVIPGRTGLQLGVHRLVRVEGVDDDPAAVLRLKAGDQLGLDVVGPGVQVQDGHGFLAAAAALAGHEDNDNGRRRQHKGSSMGFHGLHSMVLDFRAPDADRRWLTSTVVKVRASSRVERALISGVAPCLIML